MRIVRTAVGALFVAVPSVVALAQAPDPAADGPRFDVVSIRQNTGGGSGIQDRPDGGLTMINVPVATLIARAYRLEVDLASLPGWAADARFDVAATANRKGATREERDAMLRAVLADRFQLRAHVEDREYDTYDLVLAREDGRLGPGLTRVEADCAAVTAEREAARSAALEAGLPPPPLPSIGPTGPLPPCFLRTYADRQFVGRMEGQATLDSVVTALLFTTRPRRVVNKTGLPGSYQIAMEFDATPIQNGPIVVPPAPDSKPSLFTALQDQLGLKLVPSRTSRPTVVVDRIERPSQN